MAAGIWQGRFQFVHNGHYYIFKNELPKFSQKMVAIVNPNPSFAAYSNFSRFNDNRNPFNYFQRMLLWKRLADESNLNVTVVPCWHPRYKIALENDFLPAPANRYWIIPVAQDDAEEDKVRDLKKKGEKIHFADFTSEDDEFARISSTMIRKSVNEGTSVYKRYVPECIWNLTEDIYHNVDRNKYIMVPYIDYLDVRTVQRAIDCMKSNREYSYILFLLPIHVSDGELEWKDAENLPWWFKSAKHPNRERSFFRRSKIIEGLMKELGERRFLVTPVFVMKNDMENLVQYNNAFLPFADNSDVIINSNLLSENYYKFHFIEWLDAIDLSEHIIEIGNETTCSQTIARYLDSKANVLGFKGAKSKQNYCEALIEETQHTFEREIDQRIEVAQRVIDQGGLRHSEKDSYLRLIREVYPEIRIKYSTQIKRLSSESDPNQLRRRIEDIKQDFFDAIEKA